MDRFDTILDKMEERKNKRQRSLSFASVEASHGDEPAAKRRKMSDISEEEEEEEQVEGEGEEEGEDHDDLIY